MAKSKSNLKNFRKLHIGAVRIRGRAIHLRAFARAHGMSPSYLSRVLNGKRPIEAMSIRQAEIFSTAFNCTIEEFVDFIRHRPQKPVQVADSQP